MRPKDLKLIIILPALAFIFFYLGADRICAQADSADVAINYKTAYPSSVVDVEVQLKNPMPINGFQFMITVSNPDLIDFHTDSVAISTILDTVWQDTCTGPEPHGDSCFIVDSVRVLDLLVRFCHIDTTGSPISIWNVVECHGDTGDTSSPECNWIEVVGFGVGDTASIPPSPNYQTLFKFWVDVGCLSDTSTDRNVSFYMTPQGNSFLSDNDGDVAPFRYHQGDLTAWWSVPGDANGDSVVNVGDITYLVTFLYRMGPQPCMPEGGDANGDCNVNVGDVTYLVTYLYRDGPAPLQGCWHGFGKE
ncbi:MAG: hypothetical protein JSV10_06630 [Candidatus Zixiibacteriota bacterium]|nr:MAG: hypothetical protein JSV10_06630 [candidate division Zixibacteria bacterium]